MRSIYFPCLLFLALVLLPNLANANAERPHLLLMGDSISLGYTPFVIEQLEDEFEVTRIKGNGRDAAFGAANIDKWLDAVADNPPDIIHFNWGLWDLCYRHPKSKNQGKRDKVNGTVTHTPEQYRTHLSTIVERLMEIDALLIWRSTSPVPEGEFGRKVGDDLAYNNIAAKLMREHGIRIHDFHAEALPIHAEHASKPGDVHYTEEGSRLLAAAVAKEIRRAWKPPLPSRVDNTTQVYFPPIVKQQFGDCAQQTGISYMYTYEVNRALGRAADKPEHQFNGHFSYVFLNGGRNQGSEIATGWHIAQEMGIPANSVWDFTEVDEWPSGHAVYENALQQRLGDIHFFRATTTNELAAAKRWLWNHNDPRSTSGGLLGYDQRFAGHVRKTVAKDEHEAGKTIIIDFEAKKAGHFMTAVGYDDEVGYDHNGDGKITNDRDITGDGKVTLADHERGAFIIVNSHGKRFGDNGRAYVPYRIQATTDWKRGHWLAGITVSAEPAPAHVLRLRLQTEQRDSLRIELNAADDFSWQPLLFSERTIAAGAPDSPEAYSQFTDRHRRLGRIPPRGRKAADEAFEISFGVPDLTNLNELELELSATSGKLLAASLLTPEGERAFALPDASGFGDEALRLRLK